MIGEFVNNLCVTRFFIPWATVVYTSNNVEKTRFQTYSGLPVLNSRTSRECSGQTVWNDLESRVVWCYGRIKNYMFTEDFKPFGWIVL